MTNLELNGKKYSTEAEEPTYEEIQKLKWKNYRKNWVCMTDSERCRIVYEMRHTTYHWIPKDFIMEVFDWLLTELEYERIEVTSVCERKRNQLKLVEASTSSPN